MVAISFSPGVVWGLFQALHGPCLFQMGMIHSPSTYFTYTNWYFHLWKDDGLFRLDMKLGRVIIQHQLFPSHVLMFYWVMCMYMKAKAMNSTCLSMHVTIHDRMDAHALGTSWAIIISYIWRISMTILERGNWSPYSKASRYTAIHPRVEVIYGICRWGNNHPIVALKRKLHLKIDDFLSLSWKEVLI